MTNVGQVRRKPVTVVLSDGIEREIKFTLNAMAELEEKYGTVDEAFKELEKGSIKSLRFFLWSTLTQAEGEGLTERQVGALIDIASIGTLMVAIENASKEDLPQEAEVVEGTAVPN